MPYAVSAKRGFDLYKDSFAERWEIMNSFVDAVKAAALDADQPEDRLVFTPDMPQASMVHVHIKGAKEDLEAARDAVVESTGYKVFRALRGESTQGKDFQYFEWSIGEGNAGFASEEVKVAWAAFFAELGQEA